MDLSTTVTALEQRSLVSAPLRSVPSPISETAFSIAIRHKVIENADRKDLVDTLLACMHKIGIRAANLPTKEAFGVLIHYVTEYYRKHTCQEIALAFDMANAGRLDVEPNCYENFSCRYFSSIMNAYRAWAREEYKQIKQDIPMIENKESLSDQAMAEWLQEISARVRAGGYQVDFIPLALYEWMDAAGRIGKTSAEKRDYLVKAADYRLGQLKDMATKENTAENHRRFSEFSAMRKAGEFTGKHVLQLKDLAKKMILFELINATVCQQLDQPIEVGG